MWRMGRPFCHDVELPRDARRCGIYRRRRCHEAPIKWRHRLGRPVHRTQSSWTHAAADEMSRLGYGDQAHRLRRCGAALTRDCDKCGEKDAHVQIRASCDSRICPYCARVAARERASLVEGAIRRVGELTEGEVASTWTRYDKALDDLVARGRVWEAKKGARADSVRVTLARDATILTRAEKGLKDHKRGSWSWKMITISPPWAPDDAASYTITGIQKRLDDVQGRWRRLWEEGLAVFGAASAYARVECSAKAHVHSHVLYYGPWWSQEWLTEIAGCHVWIERVVSERHTRRFERDVHRCKDCSRVRRAESSQEYCDRHESESHRIASAAIREATKYALKSPTPGPSWLLRPQHAPHPELAARWQIATRHRRLCEGYGLMRTAVRLEELARGASFLGDAPAEAPTAPHCAACGADLSDVEPRYDSAARIAARLGRKWSERGTQHPVKGFLPARIVFHRV